MAIAYGVRQAFIWLTECHGLWQCIYLLCIRTLALLANTSPLVLALYTCRPCTPQEHVRRLHADTLITELLFLFNISLCLCKQFLLAVCFLLCSRVKFKCLRCNFQVLLLEQSVVGLISQEGCYCFAQVLHHCIEDHFLAAFTDPYTPPR